MTEPYVRINHVQLDVISVVSAVRQGRMNAELEQKLLRLLDWAHERDMRTGNPRPLQDSLDIVLRMVEDNIPAHMMTNKQMEAVNWLSRERTRMAKPFEAEAKAPATDPGETVSHPRPQFEVPKETVTIIKSEDKLKLDVPKGPPAQPPKSGLEKQVEDLEARIVDLERTSENLLEALVRTIPNHLPKPDDVKSFFKQLAKSFTDGVNGRD